MPCLLLRGPAEGWRQGTRAMLYGGAVLLVAAVAVQPAAAEEVDELKQEMRQLIELLEDCIGRSANIEYRPPRPEDLPITYAKLVKAKRLLGYEPQVPLSVGVREYADWFRQTHQQFAAARAG